MSCFYLDRFKNQCLLRLHLEKYLLIEVMGKRKKVQCESCGSIFNNDFQKKHEIALHGGKRVKIKVPGAPANPFIASMSSSKLNLLGNVSYYYNFSKINILCIVTQLI